MEFTDDEKGMIAAILHSDATDGQKTAEELRGEIVELVEARRLLRRVLAHLEGASVSDITGAYELDYRETDKLIAELRQLSHPQTSPEEVR